MGLGGGTGTCEVIRTSAFVKIPPAREEVTVDPSELFEAVNQGDIAAVQKMIADGVDVNLTDEYQWTPLHYAIRDSDMLMIRVLKEAGAKIDGPWYAWLPEGEPAEDWEVAELGDDVSIEEEEVTEEKPESFELFAAIENRDVDEINRLIAAGVDINERDGADRTPLIAASYEYPDAIPVLVAAGAEIDAVGLDGRTALHVAVTNYEYEAVKTLLELGADPTIKDSVDGNALDHALAQSWVVGVSLIRVYVEKKEEDVTEEKPDIKALVDVMRYKSLNEIKQLIDAGVDVNGRDANGWTALHFAARDGKLDFVKFLIDNGADVNITAKSVDGGRKSNWTALHFAARNGKLEVVQVLLDAGADADIKNGKSQTALDLAKHYGYSRIVELLESYTKNEDNEFDEMVGNWD